MLTQDEAELYDRQIRLWGVNAQSRLRQSKVLMLGFNGVASEVAKTLVLAGIDTLTIVDDLPLQKSDLTSSLFCRPQSAGDNGKQQYRTHQVKEKLKVLNPLVKVNIDNSSILSKKSEDFKNYDLITLHSFMPIEQIESINQACREVNVKFYLVIDFGFFGFVFNDLGQEFKFTHEEYDKLAEGKDLNNQALVNKQSGEEGDPINFDDEDDENNDTQSSDDIKRPRKRRRHHSPPPPTPNQTKDKKKKVTSLSYVPFRKMISFQGASFDRKSSPALVLSMAMLKFYTENNRLAGQSETGEVSEGESMKKDISRLNAIIDTLKEELNLPTSIFKRLDPDWSANIIGSLSPVCAVVGGVAGQDMIRSLSNNDIPICNTFSFDGMDMSGVVERLGIVDSSKNVAPVIRDFLELD